MTLRHDDIMTLRPDCMMPCKSMSRWWAVCGSNAGRSRGGILFFLANFSEFSSKAHHPLGEFSQKFSAKLSPNFLKLSPKGVKSGLLSPKLSPLSPKSSLFTPFSSPKWWKSGLLSLFLSPTFTRAHFPCKGAGIDLPLHRQLRATRPADGAGLYSPHSAVSPPAPASWQSNRSITKGREKARRKTKKRTMRISHSQGHGSETIAWIWCLFSH